MPYVSAEIAAPVALSARQILDSLSEAALLTDASSRILAVNPAFSRITGYSAADAVGQTPRLLKSGLHGPAFYKTLWSHLQKDGSWRGEIINRRKNGALYMEWLAISAIRDAEGRVTHYLAVFSDITRRKRLERQIRKKAFYDGLTGLPNRQLFKDRLRQAIAVARRKRTLAAVLFFDVDGLKRVNDTLGHAAGDDVLRLAGRAARSVLREEDTVARIGGDEFLILLPDPKTVDGILLTAGKTLAAVRSIALAPPALRVSASIGIAVYPIDGIDPEELIRRADAAMYAAKRQGRDRSLFFNPNLRRSDTS